MTEFEKVPSIDSNDVVGDNAATIEYQSMEIDCRHRETLIRLNTQREEQRTKAIGMAEGAILGIALFLAIMSAVLISNSGHEIAPQAQVAIFTVPIISISLIVVFVLRGVFTGFSQKEETNGLALGEAADAIRKGLS